MLGDFQKCFPNAAFPNLRDRRHQFLMCLPCPVQGGDERVPMNQEIACYAVMFFLSSLVRYQPDYMDAIADSSEAWLIESFVKSAPLELLRLMTSRVLGYSLVMGRND